LYQLVMERKIHISSRFCICYTHFVTLHFFRFLLRLVFVLEGYVNLRFISTATMFLLSKYENTTWSFHRNIHHLKNTWSLIKIRFAFSSVCFHICLTTRDEDSHWFFKQDLYQHPACAVRTQAYITIFLTIITKTIPY